MVSFKNLWGDNVIPHGKFIASAFSDFVVNIRNNLAASTVYIL